MSNSAYSLAGVINVCNMSVDTWLLFSQEIFCLAAQNRGEERSLFLKQTGRFVGASSSGTETKRLSPFLANEYGSVSTGFRASNSAGLEVIRPIQNDWCVLRYRMRKYSVTTDVLSGSLRINPVVLPPPMPLFMP